MKLIVGLGNPGKKYEATRHNAGFIAIDVLARSLNVKLDKKDFKGLYAKTKVNGEDVILLKPETFMNLSGESLRAVMDYFKIEVKDVVVIYDDIDLDVGKIRVKTKGSAGGQNGIKSIISHLGTQEFNRIRIGVGKNDNYDLSDWVLSKFAKNELDDFNESVVDATAAAEMFIKDSPMVDIMNRFN